MDAANFDAEPPKQPDRLTFALFVAAALHAIGILGISFVPVIEEMRTPPPLEVILIQNRIEDSNPEEADYLSNASQDGGGEVDENTSPAKPFTTELDFDTDGLAQTPLQATAPEALPETADQVLTTVLSNEQVNSDTPEKDTKPLDARPDDVLVEQDLEIARLANEIAQRVEDYAKRPRKKEITARTQESAAAEYMYRWAERIERIGNLNYPEQARLRDLKGAVLLAVGIFKNGNIESITIHRSSGIGLLDDAAQRIVHQAAPFEPLSGDLADETDILYIVRTWEFGADTLKSR